ncbi:MAG TPA: sensor histidine kinase [Micromonosporaceae bacterium]|nr:sensor histidine kinase [Micromonosporaceae bacterium]
MSAGPFVHDALFYADRAEYVAGTRPFVEAALAAGEPVLVAVPGPNMEVLRTALGARVARRVTFRDMTNAGRNPSRIIPWVLRAFLDEHDGRPVRIIGEPIWAGRSALEYPACVQHEALINLAFKGAEATILCPYDTASLQPRVLFDATQTHPTVIEGYDRRPSDVYTAPEAVFAYFNRAFPEPAPKASTLAFTVGELPNVRQFVARYAGRAGLAATRVADLQIAVNEIATNSVKHGGGAGTVRIWQEDDCIVCEVRDAGHITDPLVGRVPPLQESDRGRGLLMVNYLCDLVRIHSVPGATAVRVHMRL